MPCSSHRQIPLAKLEDHFVKDYWTFWLNFKKKCKGLDGQMPEVVRASLMVMNVERGRVAQEKGIAMGRC